MIDVKLISHGKTLSLSAVGHAGYAPDGSDIVCAGASSVILGLSAALSGNDVHTEISSGFALIRCADTRDARACFRVAQKALELIAAEYPKNLKLTCNFNVA